MNERTGVPTWIPVAIALTLLALAVLGLHLWPQTKLTSSDLATAQGIRWWTMTIPEGKEKYALGLRIVTHEGTQDGGGATGWQAGQRLKLFLFPPENGQLRYAILSEGNVLHGAIEAPERTTGISTGFPVGREIQPGQIVFKDTISGESLSMNLQKIEMNEVGLTFDFATRPTVGPATIENTP